MKKEYISPELEVFLMMTEDMIAQSIGVSGDYADENDGFVELSQKKRRRYAWEKPEDETPSSYWE